MDKTKRETHDSMNVDSFSRLPFLRLEPPTKEKGIRLFGIEFGDAGESESTETTTNDNTFELDSNNNNNNNKDNNNNGESSRRFACHYCRRNFPTSQALGGHQNAHKRERQLARKAQLHSAMVHSNLPADVRVYGLMNYRFGSASASSMSYPTWNRNTNNSPSAMITSSGGGGGGRFYGSSCSQQHPINGSPLALWRIPTATGIVQGSPIFNRERLLHPLPLFASEEGNTRMGPSRLAPTQNRYVFPSKPSVNDHVSLDLRL